MPASPSSAPLAAAALSVIPGPVLARFVAVLMRRMRRSRPKLFANFGRLDPATVHVSATDVRHRFAIAFGQGRLEVRVLLEPDPAPADAAIRGSLRTLIDLLEGRIDGNSMFFTRDLEITGSTAVVVAVRNTLDREEILLRDDIAALFGPLERPARRVGRRLESMAGRAAARLATLHAALHAPESGGRNLAAECDALRTEVQALKARIAKMDVTQRKRTELAATGAP